MFSAGVLGSAGVTRHRGYYDPLRLLKRSGGGYAFPPSVAGRSPPTARAAQVSQVPDESVGIRRPLPPRRARPLRLLVASRSVAGFDFFGSLATLTFVTRPNRVHAVRITADAIAGLGFGRGVTPNDRQVRYMANEHLPWLVPFN